MSSFQVDGISVGVEDTSAPYQASVATSTYTTGQHIVRARARDAAGNWSAWSSATVRFGGNVDAPQGFTIDEFWVGGLNGATSFAQTPDGRVLVAEQAGALRVIKNGVLLPVPFVQLAVDSNGERGLIGVAVHPSFTSNGFIYVHYTTAAGGTHNRISRFVANGDVAGPEQVLIDLPALSGSTNHNGGAMHFGIDGKLYVGVGDSNNSATAQDLASVFGKLLRFNDDGTVPADNPFFTSQSGLARAVWAYGLRNPFTFAIQPGTGRIHINDVGQDQWEEVNLGVVGANYGWPQSEGPANVGPGLTGPLFAYAHSAASPPGSGPGGFFTGVAVTGGLFYPPGGAFPAAYRGHYYFADWIGGVIARMDLANDNAVYAFVRLGGVLGLMTAPDGSMLVLSAGLVSRIVHPEPRLSVGRTRPTTAPARRRPRARRTSPCARRGRRQPARRSAPRPPRRCPRRAADSIRPPPVRAATAAWPAGS